MLKVIGEYIRAFLPIILVVIVLRELVVEPYRSPPGPGSPGRLIYELDEGDFFLVQKLRYLYESPKRGELVMFYSSSSDSTLISRVVGLPGETVTISRGEIKINGRPLEEPYVLVQSPHEYSTVVPDNEYFVMADLRATSGSINAGSHTWGTIQQQEIFGSAWARWFPIRRIGWIENMEK